MSLLVLVRQMICHSPSQLAQAPRGSRGLELLGRRRGLLSDTRVFVDSMLLDRDGRWDIQFLSISIMSKEAGLAIESIQDTLVCT